MKASADQATKTTSTTASPAKNEPFFTPAGGGFFAPPIQAKLTASKPGDKLEQEADQAADKVMRMPAPVTPDKEPKLQRQPENRLQRSGDGAPAVSDSAHSAIRAGSSGGQPLSGETRSFMEPRFGADFGNVRIHDDATAAGLSNQLSARAFTYQNHIFFSRGEYQPGNSAGMHLLAHELTHTIHQGQAVQRSPQVTTTATPPPIQRLGLRDALDYFADKANYIPGFRMLTIVLGFNPINMRSADRSAANILRALIELVPGGGFITQALDNHGVLTRAGAWLERRLAELGDIGGEITAGLRRFMDSLSWRDIFDLGGVWDRAKSIFTGPISRLISFAGGVVVDILKMVKDAILKPLAALAQGTRGYDLLKAILGEDPVTGEPVPRTADTLIGGFMKLIGQEDVWDNIKKGKAIERAWAWFQGALSGLMGFVRAIPRRVVDTISSLTFADIITVAGAFAKVVGAFANIAGEFISWGVRQVISLLEILFSVVAPGVMPYIAKAQAAFQTILKDPIGFVGNLVRAGKLGFENFARNIGTHLKTALIKWLTGPLGEAGVYIPQSFALMEIVKLVLSVLGLTWQNIRSKLLKIIPEPVLVVMEKTATILVTLVRDGPAAAWEQIKAELSELKDQLIGQVTEMVTTEVVKAAVMKLVSMLNPAGAVVQAIIAIYNTVTFFIQKIQQIAAVVASFIDSIAAIASGQVDSAAKKVEQVMANTLVVVIGFLAKFAGLGNIPDKLVGVVKKIRQPIDRGLDKIVAWLGNLLKTLKDKVKNALFKPRSFTAGTEGHRLYAEGNDIMLASSPARLGAALGRYRSQTPSPSAATMLLIGQADAKGNQLQTKLAKNDPSLEAEIEKLRDDIVGLLVQIMYGAGGKKTMPLAQVDFKIAGDAVEFKRQIDMQQAALTAMLVGDWQKNRARFVGFGRASRSVDSDQKRIAALARSIVANIGAIPQLTAGDRAKLQVYADAKGRITRKEGETVANEIAKNLVESRSARGEAVLHTVDQVAGGSATVYGDSSGVLGSSAVNSSIGSQWKDRIAQVDAKAADVEPSAKVNVRLTAS